VLRLHGGVESCQSLQNHSTEIYSLTQYISNIRCGIQCVQRQSVRLAPMRSPDRSTFRNKSSVNIQQATMIAIQMRKVGYVGH